MTGRQWRDALGPLAFTLGLTFGMGCGASSRQTQATVADVVGQTANAAAPVLVAEYKRALVSCLDDADDRPSYAVCRAQVDHDWTRVRLAWGHLRTLQADYATALEKGTLDIVAYAQDLRIAYCDFRADVPKRVLAKVPDLPGLPCLEFDGKEPRPGATSAGVLPAARPLDAGATRPALDGGAE